MNQTKIKEIKEISSVLMMKKGFRYLWIIDEDRVRKDDVKELRDYLEQYGIQTFVLMVEGNPADAIKVYEAETKI